MEEALLRAVLFGTPILLASLGALLAERSGVVHLGVEGVMALSALAAFALALETSPLLGLLAGMGVGVLGGVALGVFAVTLRANQFVAGLSLAALGLGASGLLGKRYEGLPLANPLPEGGLALLALGLALLLHLLLYRTRFGLYLRSVGENPKAADLFGVNVEGVRYGALALGGGLIGLAGAYLSLAYRPSWTDGMTGGLGWVAIALVILAAWEPLRAVFGAYLFGLLFFLQFRLQGSVPIPSEAFATMPYLLVILVLALSGRTRAPKALGVPFERGR
ncbi:nucleoside ABC transporter membrane protein [Thermus arciformis]|uniref:Nucleoside ABC transporter membrane protein n=1 Tax=Thermus arciformis TaxID=482827 RepID=A0A1G7HTK2_9DEIN|nr:ABC transporter permease [Thermus arciformis]SDF03564.1 nucleoside ABC transporter membrane protein [Thermus arciformis]